MVSSTKTRSTCRSESNICCGKGAPCRRCGSAGTCGLQFWLGASATRVRYKLGGATPCAGIRRSDAAVRFIAQRSLKSLPGFKDFTYDFEAAPEKLQEKKTEAVQ